jgi:3'-5' exonuclease
MPEYLYLDIETIGSSDPDVVAEVTASVTPPANYKKAETIAEWESNAKPALIKEALDRTALNGAYGQIVCIGWAWNDSDVDSFHRDDERALLTYAFAAISNGKPVNYYKPVIVGHNVAGFDIRYLWQRSFVLGVKVPAWFPRDPKPWSDDVQDTMAMWGGARDYISLDGLCAALKLPGKGNISGADVGRLWAANEQDAVAAYCRGDVDRVRSIHRKMLIAFGEAA